MPLAEVLYGFHRLEIGKRYVAFPPEDRTTWLWAGRLLACDKNHALIVIEQLNGTVAVVWSPNFPEGIRANYRELQADEELDDVPSLVMTADEAERVTDTLVTGRSAGEGRVSVVFHQCGDGWHYMEPTEGTTIDVGTADGLFFKASEEGLAETVRRLYEVAGKLCGHMGKS